MRPTSAPPLPNWREIVTTTLSSGGIPEDIDSAAQPVSGSTFVVEGWSLEVDFCCSRPRNSCTIKNPSDAWVRTYYLSFSYHLVVWYNVTRHWCKTSSEKMENVYQYFSF